ncbi:MAG TPA: hypothetical protein VGH49_19270 [Xanthobacteraceae bacterium]
MGVPLVVSRAAYVGIGYWIVQIPPRASHDANVSRNGPEICYMVRAKNRHKAGIAQP